MSNRHLMTYEERVIDLAFQAALLDLDAAQAFARKHTQQLMVLHAAIYDLHTHYDEFLSYVQIRSLRTELSTWVNS